MEPLQHLRVCKQNRKKMNLKSLTVISVWAAILSWIRCGAIAFVQRTPVTPHHEVSSSYRRVDGGASLSTPRSTSLKAWIETDDGLGVVTHWDRDAQDEIELSQRLKRRKTEDRSNNKYLSSSDEPPQQAAKNETIIRMKNRDKSHRRRRGFRMPGGSGATSDGVRFSVPTEHQEKEDKTDKTAEKPKQIQPASPGWYLTLDKSTGLQVPLNMSIGTTESPAYTTDTARQKAKLAFRVRASLLDENDTKDTSSNNMNQKMTRRREKKVRQLASLLNVPIASARTMVRKVQSLESMDIAGTLSRRCVDMSLLLQCTPSKFTSIIRHCPTLLTYRADTIATKLVQLDRLLSARTVEDGDATIMEMPLSSTEIVSPNDAITIPAPPLCGNQTVVNRNMDDVEVSESTFCIARRVPQLLVSNIPGTMAERALSLYSILFPNDYARDINSKAFTRVLKRCPELLLYNIDATIAPKLVELDVRVCGVSVFITFDFLTF